jgi:hypothetical protein
MATININGVNTITSDITGVQNVNFSYLGVKPTSIQPIDRICGVFVSDIVVADSGFVRWLDVAWDGDQDNYNLGLFVRSSNDPLSNEKWVGPFYNKTFDIGTQKGENLQFMVVMIADESYTPKLNEIQLRYVSSSSATNFYSKAFDLTFAPETILLTYNADLNNDTVVKFSVSRKDTTNSLDYESITPNKIETLSQTQASSNKLKLLIELSGEFTADVSVHEFSLTIGGRSVDRLNKVEVDSSSMSMSSDSSSSSSSSIDSSSSYSSSSSSS